MKMYDMTNMFPRLTEEMKDALEKTCINCGALIQKGNGFCEICWRGYNGLE